MSTVRGHWPSTTIFILAAIGSAAGLGNIWRFPFLAFEHGGAAFVLAIIIANIIVGIPLLAAETALGQKTQKAAPDAFGSIDKTFRYLGWFSLLLMFFVMAYYMSVMGWVIDYFIAAFNLSWGADTEGYFFNTILQISDGPGTIGGFSLPVLIGFLVSWVLVYFSVWKGVHSVSKVVVWTATLPFVILAILLIRALTLPGAGAGIAAYLIPQWHALLDPQLWIAAFSQVFFSLGIAFGIMITYGSFNKPDTEVTKSVLLIALGNFLVSFLAGFTVFGTLGYMATQQGVAVTDVVASGPGLIFVVLPQALSLLPAFAKTFAVLFFFMIITLGIDSAFSILEGVAVPFRDRFPNTSSKVIAFWVALVMMLAGLPFVTKGGLYYLDILDHFVTNYAVVLVGILEAFIIGWLWKGDVLRTWINERSRFKLGAGWLFSIKVIIPLLLIVLFVLNLLEELKTPYEGYPIHMLIWIGVVPLLLAPIVSVVLDKLTTQKHTT